MCKYHNARRVDRPILPGKQSKFTKEIQDIGKTGILIILTDPQPEISYKADLTHNWEYSGVATYLYGMAVVFSDRI